MNENDIKKGLMMFAGVMVGGVLGQAVGGVLLGRAGATVGTILGGLGGAVAGQHVAEEGCGNARNTEESNA